MSLLDNTTTTTTALSVWLSSSSPVSSSFSSSLSALAFVCQPLFLSLLLAITIAVCGQLLIETDWDRRRPPTAKTGVPFLGAAIQLGIRPVDFLQQCSKKYGSTFTLKLAGRSLIFETDPKMIARFFREKQMLTFDPILDEFGERMFGFPHAINTPLPPDCLTPTRFPLLHAVLSRIPVLRSLPFLVPPSAIHPTLFHGPDVEHNPAPMHRLTHHLVRHYPMLMGTNLQALACRSVKVTARLLGEMVQDMKEEKDNDEAQWHHHPNLFTFVQRHVFNSANEAMWGDNAFNETTLTSDSESITNNSNGGSDGDDNRHRRLRVRHLQTDLLNHFLNWDEAVPILASGMVPQGGSIEQRILGKALTSRARVQQALHKVHESTCFPAPHCSRFMLNRDTLFRTHELNNSKHFPFDATTATAAATATASASASAADERKQETAASKSDDTDDVRRYASSFLGVMQSAMFWAAHGNTMPAAFWLLYHVLRDARAKAEIQAEVDAFFNNNSESKLNGAEAMLQALADSTISFTSFMKNDSELSSSAAASTSIPWLRYFTLLDSALSEAMRLTTATMSVRRVHRDLMWKEKKNENEKTEEAEQEKAAVSTEEAEADESKLWLHRGEEIAVTSVSMHFNQHVYPDPHTFKFDRFVVDDRRSSAMFRRTHLMNNEHCPNGYHFLPFGNGAHMCPGRHFARVEVVAFAVMMFRFFDMELVAREKEARVDWSRFGLGTLSPMKEDYDKLGIRYRLRTL